MKKLFVGNLAWEASEDNLKPLFEEFGPVASVKVITDPHTGRSRGFAFVEMENADDVDGVIEALNEKPFLNRNLRISVAKERTERSERGSGGGGGGGGGDRRPPRRSYR